MRARREVFTVLPRIGMELYGQPQPVVYGDSIIRGGSISGLSGTLRPDRSTGWIRFRGDTLGIGWEFWAPQRPHLPDAGDQTLQNSRQQFASRRIHWLDADRTVVTDAGSPAGVRLRRRF